MKQNNLIMRFIAFTVVVTFTVTNLQISPSAFAATGVPISEVFPLAAGTLAIPAEFGQVTDTIIGDPKAPALIHIQSAHGSYAAEKNIVNILGYIEKNSSVKLMLLEGAASKLHPEMFRIFPKHPDFNRKVTDKLMQEGYLTGPETFLIESEKSKVEGWGMEDLAAYKTNRDDFIQVIKSDKTAKKSIAELRAAIDKKFSAKLNKNLLTLVRQEEAFGSGTVSFEAWLKLLGEASRKHLRLDLSDAFYQDQYPFLIRYYRLRAIGSKIDREKARQEAVAFLKELETRKIPKDIVSSIQTILNTPETSLLKTGNGYSSLRLAFDRAFTRLPHDFSMKPWPAWTLYAQYVILMQELETKGLQDEVTKLKDRIFQSLAKTTAEKEYLAEARKLYLLRRLFSLELTRAEYEELSSAQSTKSEVKNLATEAKKLADKAMSFYSTAIVREQHMFSNALKQMGEAKQTRAVIVTGGFHADGLKRLAAARNCSYIQITPRIMEISKKDREVYLKSMLGSRDVETSQIAALLGVVDRAQRAAITGREQAREWFGSVRGLIRGLISTEPVSNQSDLVAALGSFLGVPTPALVSAKARSESRNGIGVAETVINRSEVRFEILDGNLVPDDIKVLALDWSGTVFDKGANQLMGGVQGLLTEAKKRGVRTVIVTYNPSQEVIAIFKVLGISVGDGKDDLVADVLGKDKVPAGEENVKLAHLRAILAEGRFRSAQIVAVGDAPKDIIEGRDAGVISVAFVPLQENESALRQVHPSAITARLDDSPFLTYLFHRSEIRSEEPAPQGEKGALQTHELLLGLNDPRIKNIVLSGGKGASLAELANIPGIRVPPAFVLSTEAYQLFLEANPKIIHLIEDLKAMKEEKQIARQAKKIQSAIRGAAIPEEALEAIRIAYQNLRQITGEENPLVSVRSSASAEDMPTASFAGQYSTYLYREGIDAVIQSVRDVWASTYNVNAISYRNARGIDHFKTRMAVPIQLMIDASVAGTAFTVDLETGAPFYRIHTSYGVGEMEVSGKVTPDAWVVDPEKMEIVKRTLGQKKQKMIYDRSARKVRVVDVPAEEQAKYAISSAAALEMARALKRIGDHYRKSRNLVFMDTEFAFDKNGVLFFTQARPETVFAKGLSRIVGVDLKNKEVREKPVLVSKQGTTGSFGVISGILRIVKPKKIAGEAVKEAQRKVKKGDILVVTETTNIWERVLSVAGGAISEIGGSGSHTAVVTREQGKPSLVGVPNVLSILEPYDGQRVTLDATQKTVLLSDVPQSQWIPVKLFGPAKHGLLDDETFESSFSGALKLGQGIIDLQGRIWIGKPNYAVSPFVQQVYVSAHRWMAHRLGVSMQDAVQDGVYRILANDMFKWRLQLRTLTLEQLAQLHEERLQSAEDFLKASREFVLTTESFSRWMETYNRLNGHMGASYALHQVLLGWLREISRQKDIPEPYNTQIASDMGPLFGETQAKVALRDYKVLLEKVRGTPGLSKTLATALKNKDLGPLRSQATDFSQKLWSYSTNYKITQDVDLNMNPEDSVFHVMDQLVKDAAQKRKIVIPEAQAAEFYPEDARFQLAARLAFESERARQDSHHLKVRGQWFFLEKINELLVFLREKSEAQTLEDVFIHPPEWLREQIARYQAEQGGGVRSELRVAENANPDPGTGQDAAGLLLEKLVAMNADRALAQKAIEKYSAGQFRLSWDLEVLGQDGKVIGTMDRRLIHETGLLHYSANSFVLTPDGKFLLQRRVHNKPEARKLSICGGHPEMAQGLEGGIRARLMEELELDNLRGRLIEIGREDFLDENGKNNEKRVLYAYVLTPAEYEQILKASADFEKMKAGMTQKEFEGTIEAKQRAREGKGGAYGRVFAEPSEVLSPRRDPNGRYVVITEPFLDAKGPENVHFSGDLLERLLDQKEIVDRLRDILSGLKILQSAETLIGDPKVAELAKAKGRELAAQVSVESFGQLRSVLALPMGRFSSALADAKPLLRKAFPFIDQMDSKPRYRGTTTIWGHSRRIAEMSDALGGDDPGLFYADYEGIPFKGERLKAPVWNAYVKLGQDYFEDSDNRLALRLANLFHDIGVLVQMPAHEPIGALMVKEILDRLPVPEKVKLLVLWEVGNHLNIGVMGMGERTPKYSTDRLNVLPQELRATAHAILVLLQAGEVRSLVELSDNGKLFNNRSGLFYIKTADSKKFKELSAAYGQERLKRFCSGGDWRVKKAKYAEAQRLIQEEIPAEQQAQFWRYMNEVNEWTDYGVYIAMEMTAKSLVYIHYLLSQVAALEHNEIAYFRWTTRLRDDARPAAEGIEKFLENQKVTLDDLTLVGKTPAEIQVTKAKFKVVVSLDRKSIEFDSNGFKLPSPVKSETKNEAAPPRSEARSETRTEIIGGRPYTFNEALWNRVEDATVGDAQAIIKLSQMIPTEEGRSLQSSPEAIASSIGSRGIRGLEWVTLVYREQGSVKGYVSGWFKVKTNRGGIGSLLQIAVAGDSQGQGIGDVLVARFLKLLEEKGVTKLLSIPRHDALKKILEKYGFNALTMPELPASVRQVGYYGLNVTLPDVLYMVADDKVRLDLTGMLMGFLSENLEQVREGFASIPAQWIQANKLSLNAGLTREYANLETSFPYLQHFAMSEHLRIATLLLVLLGREGLKWKSAYIPLADSYNPMEDLLESMVRYWLEGNNLREEVYADVMKGDLRSLIRYITLRAYADYKQYGVSEHGVSFDFSTADIKIRKEGEPERLISGAKLDAYHQQRSETRVARGIFIAASVLATAATFIYFGFGWGIGAAVFTFILHNIFFDKTSLPTTTEITPEPKDEGRARYEAYRAGATHNMPTYDELMATNRLADEASQAGEAAETRTASPDEILSSAEASGTDETIIIGKAEVNEDTGASVAVDGFTNDYESILAALRDAGISARFQDNRLPGDVHPENSGPTYEHEYCVIVSAEDAPSVRAMVATRQSRVETRVQKRGVENKRQMVSSGRDRSETRTRATVGQAILPAANELLLPVKISVSSLAEAGVSVRGWFDSVTKIMGGIVTLGAEKWASFKTAIARKLFPERSQPVAVMPEAFKTEHPKLARMVAQSVAASEERKVIAHYSGVPDVRDIAPFVSFLRYNSKVTGVLALTGVRDVTAFREALIAAGAKDVLGTNLTIESFGTAQEFLGRFNRLRDETPRGTSMAFVTDGSIKELADPGLVRRGNRKMLRVKGSNIPHEQAAAVIGSAIKILEDDFVARHQNDFVPMVELGVQALLAEFATWLAAARRTAASA